MTLTKKTAVFSGLLFAILLSLTTVYAQDETKPVISRQPAGGTFSKNSPARFQVDAHSRNSGYLSYQWYRSQLFDVPQTNAATIKQNATPLPEGKGSVLLTTTPSGFSATKYCYYWAKIYNTKNNVSDSIECMTAQVKIVNRTLHTSVMKGDFEGRGQGSNKIPVDLINYYWNTTHDGQTADLISKYPGYSSYPKKVLEIYPTSIYDANSDIKYTNHAASDKVCELSSHAASSNYQDVATVPGKIYEWSLDHAARLRDIKTDPQVMAVIIGPAINMATDYTDFNITARWINDQAASPDYVYPYGKNYTTYFYDILNKLAKDRNATVTSFQNMQPDNSAPYITTYGSNTYYIYISSDKRDSYFVYRSGVYTVPAGQGTTVFGFVPITIDNGVGNLIDNVVFASGSPLYLSPEVEYSNDAIIVSDATRAGYVYGIVEVRGSSVSLVADAKAYYDPDGAGAAPEESIAITGNLGNGGWYSTYGQGVAFTAGGVVSFKNLVPGKTYRIVGIPRAAVSIAQGVNETPEYVLDEGYYRNVKMGPAFAGNDSIVWNIEVDAYHNANNEKKARISVVNARNDVEYALLADNGKGNTIPDLVNVPAHSNTAWKRGVDDYATFDGLELDTFYYLVARSYGYEEVTYSVAAFNVDGVTPIYMPIKTPDNNFVEINPEYLSRPNCTQIELSNSVAGQQYAVVDPATGAIVGGAKGVQTGDGSTLVFAVPDFAKTYRIVSRNSEINWSRGARIYGCPKDLAIDYLLETVSEANGYISTDIEYVIRGNDVDTSWIYGATNNWISGIGTQPLYLSANILAGNTKSVLDSLQAINDSATLFCRVKLEQGYSGPFVRPVKELVIPPRPEAPVKTADYRFDYPAEQIKANADSLQFAQINTAQWTKEMSWSFVASGWGEGASERPFNIRFPADTVAKRFASIPRRDTILKRPDAPNLEFELDNGGYGVITDLIADTVYEYHVSSGTTWENLEHSGGKSTSPIALSANDTCFVRITATSTSPASFITTLSNGTKLIIYPVNFGSYKYGATPPNAAGVYIKSRINATVSISLAIDGDKSNYYNLSKNTLTIAANASDGSVTLQPKANLAAGTYTALLTATFMDGGQQHTASADVYLTVEKAEWNMSDIQCSFDTDLSKAQKLVLNITDAPAGATLLFYNGQQNPFPGAQSLVDNDGKTTFTFTSDHGLQPSSTYSVYVLANADNNHHASATIPLCTGYTAYATPVFGNVIDIDYVNEKLIFKSGFTSNDYIIKYGESVIGNPTNQNSLTNILDNTHSDKIMFSIVRKAGVAPPYPASEPDSVFVAGRRSEPTVTSVSKSSSLIANDGKIVLHEASNFEYRIHGTNDNWTSASNTTGLGVNNYDVRYPAVIKSAFASHVTEDVQICTYPSAVVTPAKQTICHNTQPAPLTSTATNFINAEYQWQKSVAENNGVWTGWTNVTEGTGGTTASYTPPSLTQSTAYRVKVYEINSACDTIYSDTAVTKVNPIPTVTVPPTATQTICGGVKTGDIVLSGVATEYRWEVISGAYGVLGLNAPNGITTNDAITFPANTNNTGYNPVNVVVQVTPYYSGNCYGASDEFTVTVNPRSTANHIAADAPTVCYGAKATVKVAASGVAIPVFKWYASQTAETPFHTGNSYTSSGLLADTIFYIGVSGDVHCENLTGERKEVMVRVDPVCAITDKATSSCEEMPLIINILANDTLNPATCGSPVVEIVEPPKNGSAKVKNNEIEYIGKLSGLDSLLYRVSCGGGFSEAKVYIRITASGSAFVDDVWYYGMNSQGIRFDHSNGVYFAKDASGESKVNSHENSLVVSSPYCNGQNIFYSSHTQLYNSFHEPMKNGHFEGDYSVADGLAACYMGNNKYLFFSITNAYETGDRGLKAYVVDMNGDHGKGEIVKSIEIEPASAHMSESIELLAANEAHKYWLVYASKSSSDSPHYLHVRKVDVSNAEPAIESVAHSMATSTTPRHHTYTLKASQQHDRIAIANSDDLTVDVFDFDNVTGIISTRRTTSHQIEGLAYGVEFSPDGKQLYAAGYTRGTSHTLIPKLCQYKITSTGLEYVDQIKYWTFNGSYSSRGGGLKLGPDGKIYVILAYDVHVGVVSNPDQTTSLSHRYSTMPLDYSAESYALQFSTGITKPSIMECNTNIAPLAQPDEDLLCLTHDLRTARVNVLKNDSDADANDKIYLTSAKFVNASDTTLAYITVNAADSTISLTVKPDTYISVAGHIFDVTYNIKDNGTPASQCAEGLLSIKVYHTPNYPDIRVHVCPNSGIINLSKYIDTTDHVTDIQWSHKIPSIHISPLTGSVSTEALSSSRFHDLTYTVTSRCVSEQKRQFYLEVMKNGRVRQTKDTIKICHKYADAVHINQLLGIEAPGVWTYHAVKPCGTPQSIDDYVTKSDSPIHNGAMIMNGKGIYEDTRYDSCHPHNAKMAKFIYTTDVDSCLGGNTYHIVILLTEDVI